MKDLFKRSEALTGRECRGLCIFCRLLGGCDPVLVGEVRGLVVRKAKCGRIFATSWSDDGNGSCTEFRPPVTLLGHPHTERAAQRAHTYDLVREALTVPSKLHSTISCWNPENIVLFSYATNISRYLSLFGPERSCWNCGWVYNKVKSGFPNTV